MLEQQQPQPQPQPIPVPIQQGTNGYVQPRPIKAEGGFTPQNTLWRPNSLVFPISFIKSVYFIYNHVPLIWCR
eukprot:gnl/Chilomastix_caulleri/4632.p2 GENE.gnl/Chilomastix_caulleri/4632~~gnl/Chilomastix_caulleri/4632.p2  ORF type:complete len:73 (+),score=19.11 gnl/Chilomastix_caulleri/4632:49-267(+)